MLPSLPVEPTPIESSKLQYATPEPAITQRTLLTQSSRAWFTEPEEEHAESDVTALHQYQSLNPTFALPDSSATHIISSPYDDLSNQLDLQPLRLSARLFAVALTCLAPTRSDYATAPYQSTFNWPAVLTTLQTLCLRSGLTWKEQQFYVVIFRSKLRKGVDRVRLRQLDKRSHEEACANGGLLKYWFGNTDEGMRNLATCIWRNAEDAVAGGRGPWHSKARSAAGDFYEEISFNTCRLIIEAGAQNWRLEECNP